MSDRENPKSEPPTEDRRRALREKAFVLAQVTCPSGKVRLGAIDGASATGVALLIRTLVEVGDRLEIAIELDDDEWFTVEGDVVRREDVPPEGPWLFRAGVAIDPPSDELRANAARIQKRRDEALERQRQARRKP